MAEAGSVVFETLLPIDHLVYVVPDLQRGPKFLSSLLFPSSSSSSSSTSSSEKEKQEVQPVFGGKHSGRGTQNSLISLGAQTYFEFISLNPEENALFEPSSSSSPAPHRMFGLTCDNSRLPWIRAWMIRILGDVELHGEMVRKALQETGLEFKVSQGSRELPSSAKTEEQEGKGGRSVHWSLFVPTTYSNPEPFIPIGISWSQTPPGESKCLLLVFKLTNEPSLLPPLFFLFFPSFPFFLFSLSLSRSLALALSLSLSLRKTSLSNVSSTFRGAFTIEYHTLHKAP
jgi:hypothetical protein